MSRNTPPGGLVGAAPWPRSGWFPSHSWTDSSRLEELLDLVSSGPVLRSVGLESRWPWESNEAQQEALRPR